MASPTAAQVIESRPPNWRDDIAGGLAELWRARDLVWQLAARDIKLRYREAAMGLAWAVVMPVVLILSGLIIRSALSQAQGTGLDRAVIGGLGLKALVWSFFSGALGFGTTSLTSSGHLVSKIYFPRAALPLAATLTHAFDATIALSALTLALPWLGASASSALLWVPVLLALTFALTLGIVLAMSCANVFFRDVKYLVQVALTFGVFVTPVFYDTSMLDGATASLIALNPLTPLLEGIVLAVQNGHNLLSTLTVVREGVVVTVWEPSRLWYATAWAVGALAIGGALFRRAEAHFADFV